MLDFGRSCRTKVVEFVSLSSVVAILGTLLFSTFYVGYKYGSDDVPAQDTLSIQHTSTDEFCSQTIDRSFNSTKESDCFQENNLRSYDYVKQWFMETVRNLTIFECILFDVVMLIVQEGVCYVSENLGKWIHAKKVPLRAKHLDNLSKIDYICIAFCRLHAAPMSALYFKFCVYEPNIYWGPNHWTIWNALVPLIPLFIVYELFYTLFHMFLHIPIIYPYMHKYHHKQTAPSRGHTDVSIINPTEIMLVHYNHLLALYVCCTFFFESVHFTCAITFFMLSGVLADLNHTRYDITISFPFFGQTITLFDSKDHDVHHRIPNANFALNITFWDRIFGSYRPYNPDEKVNPLIQLDPKTGKTISAIRST